MRDYIKEHKSMIIYTLVNVFVFLFMFAINSIYPLCWDDNGVIKDFDVNNWGIIDVLKHSYYRYYLNWSGKYVPLTIATVFTLLDKAVYNFVNSVLYVVFVNVIYRFCWNKKYNSWILISIYAALWIFVPWYGTVVFWLDGTVEYLWMLIPVLLFGMVYYKNYFGYSSSSKSCSGMFLLGVLAGCGLEATGSALIFALIVMVIVKAKKGIRIALWEICGIVGTLIGFATLMLAPGNYARVDAVSEISDRYANVLYRFARESFFTVLYLTPLFGSVIVLTLILYNCRESNEKGVRGFKNTFMVYYSLCKEQVTLTAIGMVSIYVMTFVSAFAARVFLTPTVLLIIACGITVRMIYDTNIGHKLLGEYNQVIKVMLIFICIFVISQMLASYIFCLYSGEPITKNVQFVNTLNDVRLFD